MKKHLVLIGGGHAHMVTLANLETIVEKGHGVTVIGPSDYHYYSGMGPGMLSGTYRPEEIRFATRRSGSPRAGRCLTQHARPHARIVVIIRWPDHRDTVTFFDERGRLAKVTMWAWPPPIRTRCFFMPVSLPSLTQPRQVGLSPRWRSASTLFCPPGFAPVAMHAGRDPGPGLRWTWPLDDFRNHYGREQIGILFGGQPPSSTSLTSRAFFRRYPG